MSHTWMSHLTHMNKSCYTCECGMSTSPCQHQPLVGLKKFIKINACCHFANFWQVASCSLKIMRWSVATICVWKEEITKGYLIWNLQEHGWQSSIHMFWSCRQLRLTPAVWQSDLDASTLDALFVSQVPALDSSYSLFCSPQWWCAMTL